MKWFTDYRIKIVWIGIVVAMVVGGRGKAAADFVFDAVRAEDIPPSGKGVSFSHDGLRLYISTGSDILYGGYGDRDIWVVERESPNAPWGEPVNLGANVNTGDMEGWPTISPDDLELYFGRDDGYSWYPMRSTRDSKDDPWGPATKYTGVYPDDFSSDGLTKYTEADWPDGYGGSDIWVTTRATIDDEWGEPMNLGPNVNNSGEQYGPSISSDGLALFFISITTQRRLHMCVRATKYDPWGPAVDVGPPVNGSWWVVFPEISPDGSTLYCSRGSGNGFTQVSIKPIVDFNGDMTIDLLDLVMLIDHWGTEDTLYDIGPMPWGDGIVDVQDLRILVEYIEPPVPLPIAHWTLDETDGAMAFDSVGDNDAMVMGNAAWQPTGGKVGGALAFDGVGDFILADIPAGLGAGPFSVCAWVKGGAPGQAIVSPQGDIRWLYANAIDGSLTTDLSESSGVGQPLYSDAVVTDGQWHRVMLVWDGAGRILYVDDEEVASDPLNAVSPPGGKLIIGAGGSLEPGSPWSGLIDDVRIYNRVVKP